MSPVDVGPTRREQRRQQTLTEIRALAMRQVADAGPDAMSLNAIARSMAMSPAALYRYFDSRDALLADLVVTCYHSLADALEAAGATGEPDDQFIRVTRAYRAWALDNPHEYRLIFQTTVGSGQDLAPDRTVPAATRSMLVILAALAGVAGDGASEAGPGVDGGRLGEEIRRWAARSGLPDLPPSVLALGLLSWTRLHGVISLELGHHLASTGVDPALLYEAEIRMLLSQLSPNGPRPPRPCDSP